MAETKTSGTVPGLETDALYSRPEPPPPYQAATSSSYEATTSSNYQPTASSNVPHPVHTAAPQFVTVGTTVTTGSPVIPMTRPGPRPTLVFCRSCNFQIVTRVEYLPSMRTHLLAAILCLIGCWPFICVPYCIDTCNNADHFCPNCNAYIGTYRI